MGYNQDAKEQVIQRINIVDLISEYIPLKKAGANFKGICPFHNEKTPSFVVSPEKQIFHCFGCHAGGDAFSFVMQHDRLTFPEALRMLAQRAGVQIQESYSPHERKQREQARGKKEIYAEAARFYHDFLNSEGAAEQARRYVKSRAYGQETVDQFLLGFAPGSGTTLLGYLKKQGFSDVVLAESGLFSRSEKGFLRDFFWNRLMFPIQNARGEVIAFGGRVLDNSLPKYINTAETAFFRKRSELYGLHEAKKHISQTGFVIVVEGYFDVIRLHQSGFQNAVATLGTALTADHARTIRRYTNKIVVIFDNDTAGIEAAVRGIDVVMAEGLEVQVLTVPGSKDPDEFLKENSRESFQMVLTDHVKDFFDFRLDLLLVRHNKDNPHGKAAIIADMLQVLAKIDNHIVRESYMQQLARRLNVSEHALKQEFGRSGKPVRQRHRLDEEEMETAAATEHSAEIALVMVLLKEHHLWKAYVAAEIEEAQFTDVRVKEILACMRAFFGDLDLRGGDLVSYISVHASEAAKVLVSNLVLDEREIEFPEGFLNDRICELLIRQKEHILAEMNKKIAYYHTVDVAERNDDEYVLCCQQFTVLKKELSDLKGRRR